MGTLDGKFTLVTGASRGIGRAIARRLASEGAQVVLTGRDEAALADAAAEIQAAGGTAETFAGDLRDEGTPGALRDFVVSRFGALDILVNNAGATKRGAFPELSDTDWQDGFALKFFGAVRLTRAVWPILSTRQGSVVNIAGIGGRTPGADFAIGGSVNAALLSLTKALADQGVRDGVQVNAINPGPVRTDRFVRRLEHIDEAAFVREAQITRVGEPEDIAGLVAFMAGPAGRLLHGALIDMDGGQTKTL